MNPNERAELLGLVQQAIAVCQAAIRTSQSRAADSEPPEAPDLNDGLEPYSGVETDIEGYVEMAANDEAVETAIKASRETNGDPASTHQGFNALMKTLPPDTARDLREVVRLYGR